jgi:hypothetical protein
VPCNGGTIDETYEAEGLKIQLGHLGNMVGYFTTEVGATQVLQYEATPGEYIPCAPLNEIGRTWAT